MKCIHVQEGFAFYWDLHEQDERKLKIDQHMCTCADCARQFNLWHESMVLLHDERESLPESKEQELTVNAVMKRIYSDSPWQQPVTERTSHRSDVFRSRFLVFCAVAIMILLGCMIYAIPGVLESDKTVEMAKSVQMTVSSEWTVTESGATEASYSLTLFALASTLMAAILMIIGWYTRLRE